MSTPTLASGPQLDARLLSKRQRILRKLRRDLPIYLILLPGILFLLLFKIGPMFGLIIAFQNYQPYLGVFGSPWVGFEHFRNFLLSVEFPLLFGNTLMLSLYNIIFYFPAPIILALLLNEIRVGWYKRTIQTMVYVPHFISIVIVCSISWMLLTSGSIPSKSGAIYRIVEAVTGQPYDFLTELGAFRPMITIQTIWKETGWGTIVFLAALSGVDEQLYEAAVIDGASRFRQLWHITLPSIRGTIIIMLILRMGTVLDNGFEQILLMSNAMNRPVSNVFDVFVYENGIRKGSFSYTAAIGFFKSIVALILVTGTNWIARRAGDSSLY